MLYSVLKGVAFVASLTLVVSACQDSPEEEAAQPDPEVGSEPGEGVELPSTEPVPPVGDASPTADLSSVVAWSDPTIWPDGQVPGTGQHVTIPEGLQIRVDTDVEVAGLSIDGELYFDPASSVTLRSNQNIVVNGMLHMKPADPSVDHVIEFFDVYGDDFQGGGIEVLASDVGLWVMGEGRLVLEGAPRRGWTNVTDGVASGTSTVEVVDATGWQVGDEVVLSPTAPPGDDGIGGDGLADGFHETTISEIDGNTVTFAEAPPTDHPLVDGQYTPELINLTRNVTVRAADESWSHVLVHGHAPQFVRWASFSQLGVPEVLGRYPLHFHHGFDGTVGTLIEGVVVREAANHAFVPHLSNGITMRDLVAYRVLDGDAYWWDEAEATNDLLIEHAIAAATNNSGFFLGQGSNMTLRDAVAVGGKNQFNDGGFEWVNESVGNWIAEDLVAHNNAASGIRVWQNADIPQVVDGFAAYHNHVAGIDHGAYRNRYLYRNAHLFGNGVSGLIIHATPDPAGIRFENTVIDSAGLMEGSFVTLADANIESDLPILLRDVEFRGETDQPVFNFATETVRLARCVDCSWPDDTELAGFTPGTPDTSWLEVISPSSSQRYLPDGSVEDVSRPLPSEPGSGSGLTVQYFDDAALNELVYETALPATIDTWGGNSERPEMGIAPYHQFDITDGLSTRWAGELEVAPGDGGTYTFSTAFSGGLRLWIDDELLIDDWENIHRNGGWDDPESAGYNQVTVDLSEGRHSFRLEASNNLAEVDPDEIEGEWEYFLELYWQTEGGEREVIPASQLYPTDDEVPSYEPVSLEPPQ